jgi:hypothetical protein
MLLTAPTCIVACKAVAMRNPAAPSENGDDNRQLHQRTEQEIGATSEKPEDIT